MPISKSMTARAVKLSMKTCRHVILYTWMFWCVLEIYLQSYWSLFIETLPFWTCVASIFETLTAWDVKLSVIICEACKLEHLDICTHTQHGFTELLPLIDHKWTLKTLVEYMFKTVIDRTTKHSRYISWHVNLYFVLCWHVLLGANMLLRNVYNSNKSVNILCVVAFLLHQTRNN